MDRNTFDSLEVLDQLEYINNELEKGSTITSLCKSIGIGRSTIRDRFKKINYEYDKGTNKYQYTIDVIEPLDEVAITRELKSSNKVVVAEKQESSKLVVRADIVNNKVLEEFLLNYETMNNKLDQVYEWYLKSSNDVVIEESKLNIEDFEGDLVTRSFKIYEPIQKEFAEFCAGSKYKVQDILSQAIKEFMDKYK